MVKRCCVTDHKRYTSIGTAGMDMFKEAESHMTFECDRYSTCIVQ